MEFLLCVWNSVSSVHSPQLQYHHPAIRSHYGTIASDAFEHYKYPASRLGENSEDSCNCGCENSKTLDDSLHRWTSPVNGWYRARWRDDNWHQVNNDCHSSKNTCSCFSVYTDDSCCHSSVKRHAQLFSEFPAAHRCEFCDVTRGSCVPVCVFAWCLTCMWWRTVTAKLSFCISVCYRRRFYRYQHNLELQTVFYGLHYYITVVTLVLSPAGLISCFSHLCHHKLHPLLCPSVRNA